MTYNFHSSCNRMHLSFKGVCNKEHMGVICNMTSLSNSSKSTRPIGRVLGKNYSSFLDFALKLQEDEWNFCPLYLIPTYPRAFMNLTEASFITFICLIPTYPRAFMKLTKANFITLIFDTQLYKRLYETHQG